MNKVELSLSKYEEMRDKIEELEGVVKAHDASNEYVVKNIVERAITEGNTIQRVLHTSYTTHDKDELETLISGSRVLNYESQISRMESLIDSYKQRVKSLEEQLNKCNVCKKWYQFWK